MQNRPPSDPIVIPHSWVPRVLSVFVRVEGITLWPFVFLRGNPDPLLINHESIHFAQHRELWVLGFYAVYVYDFFKGLLDGYPPASSYMRIRLEREAYQHEADFTYLDKRRPFVWREL